MSPKRSIYNITEKYTELALLFTLSRESPITGIYTSYVSKPRNMYMAFLCLSEFTMIKILSCAYKHCHSKFFTIWVKYYINRRGASRPR